MNERSDRRTSAVGVGRPRDPNVDCSILAATRELLVETGYQKTTITAIARRAGVGTSAIYRRWATKESIIEDAVFGIQDASLPATTANLRDDLLTWTRWFLTQIAEPATRAAIPGLLSAYHHDDGAYERLVRRSEHPARVALTERVAAAFPGRSIEATTAAADTAFDLLVAVTIVRGLTNGLVDAEAFCARIADSLALLVTVNRAELDAGSSQASANL
ncbi:TetR family transcriptional regulator [Prescottella equi]|uniref:TetR/AcrR family transcriptional regulator n=1 Tax=Rhodococcus hoagii TaxID=43767 RepID=UPI0009F0AE30|nr:TetR/AcrR family transcriptional regulator [Prescottella equi]OQQ21536.1 TetR family transcriptional regulator [Prescottella equi]